MVIKATNLVFYNLKQLKNAANLLNKNGLLVIKVDKPVNVVSSDNTLIY